MITHPAPPPRQGRGLAHWQAVLLLGVALFLVYAQTGHYGYIDFDDTAYIEDNLMVRRGLSLEGVRWAFSSFYAANWHPLTWLSHMADVSLFGMDLGAHHLVNVALHGAVSVLLYALVIALLARRDAALAAAMLFLIHPQHVESVAWLAERKDLLCALFYLAALLAYVRFARAPSRWRMVTVLVLYALALLSKPMAVTLPVVLLILDVWPLGRASAAGTALMQRVWLLLREKIAFIPLTLGACVLTVVAQGRSGAISFLGQDISNAQPYQVARQGLGFVPEDRRVFSELTVLENLSVGRQGPRQFPDGSPAPYWTHDKLFKLFPNLGEMQERAGGRMSGGEQQMLTVARTLMGNPLLVLLDEPSEGVAPVIVEQMADMILALKAEGVSILLSEQNLHFAQWVSDRAYVLEKGQIRHQASMRDLVDDEEVQRNYLSV